MKKLKEILVCGTEGGQIKLLQKEASFFYTSDETTLSHFNEEFSDHELTSTSSIFENVEDALNALIKKYSIFKFSPILINSKYSPSIRKAYYENATDGHISDEWQRKLFKIASFEAKFSNLTVHSINKAWKKVLSQLKEDNYTRSYPYFVDYSGKESLDIPKFVICTNMAYGWMPTVLNLDLSQRERIQFVLEKLNSKETLNLQDYEILKRSINNSIVGMSKFLHFVNPSKYPILDSKIYRFITNKKFASGINQPTAYMVYLNRMNELIKDSCFNSLYESVQKKLGKNLTRMRCIELIMFYYK